jgi:transposase
LAMAGLSLRCPAAGVRGRERLSHLHNAPESQGGQGKEGLRQGAEEPRQEHHSNRRDHPRRGDGRVDESVEGATDALAFEVYVEHFLAPSLEKGQVVVLDGLGAHRIEKLRELIEARGADLVFLPSYSPDLNPIEEAFSKKIKALVRKVDARVREALVEAIGRALAAVTPDDAAGWFAHAGYWPQDQPL